MNPTVTVAVGFVRHRNALVARADVAPILEAQAAHGAAHWTAHEREFEPLFQRGLAAFVLHCASRPRPEHIAWTINLQVPHLNLFLTGDNTDGTVAGRVFTEGVKDGPENLFFAETQRAGGPVRRSVIGFAGPDIVEAAEAFYARSEQRPVRFFEDGRTFTLLASHPDCDHTWFESIDAAGIAALADTEHVQPLERRAYAWRCGCSLERIVRLLRPAFAADPDGLFEGAASVSVQCPRCGASHRVTREALDAADGA